LNPKKRFSTGSNELQIELTLNMETTHDTPIEHSSDMNTEIVIREYLALVQEKINTLNLSSEKRLDALQALTTLYSVLPSQS